jgi:hypothetical protein
MQLLCGTVKRQTKGSKTKYEKIISSRDIKRYSLGHKTVHHPCTKFLFGKYRSVSDEKVSETISKQIWQRIE